VWWCGVVLGLGLGLYMLFIYSFGFCDSLGLWCFNNYEVAYLDADPGFSTIACRLFWCRVLENSKTAT
jgi:hypothetical protein